MSTLQLYQKVVSQKVLNHNQSVKIVKIIFWAVLLVLSLKLGADLRGTGYQVIPDPFIILDEHTNVWHGLSLRATGIPTAWSILPTYLIDSKVTGAGGPVEGFTISVDGKKASLSNYSSFPKPVIGSQDLDFGRGKLYTQFVQPYLDHPPFGALVLSSFVSKNVTTFSQVNNYDLRRVALYLAILTQILIFALAFLVTRKPLIGIIASTVYATAPSYVLLSRYALLENVLTPLVLAGIILIILARNKPSLLLLAGIIGGLAALTKLSGWVFIFSNVILLYLWKFKLKNILFYAVPAFFIGILYFAWGFYLAPKVFTDLLLLQGQRDFIGSINVLVSFFRVNIFNFPLDGWWIGGFIALLVVRWKREYLPIIATVIAALFSALGLSGANYPWYFIPLIPFMTIAVAIFFYDLAVRPTVLSIIVAFFTFVSGSFYWGYGVFQKSQPFTFYRLIFLLFIGAGAFWALYRNLKKFEKAWYIGIIVLLLILTLLNRRSMFFTLENWGKLPPIYTPGTF